MPKTKTKKTKKTKFVKRRIPRAIKYKGDLAITRHTSLSTISGVDVDAVYLQKNNNNLLFSTGGASSTVYYGSMAFKARLSDIWNYTEFQAMYDSYCIDKVQLSFIPYATVASAGAAVSTTSTQNALIMHYFIDHDDSALPSNSEAGVNDMRERKGYRSVNILSRMGKAIKVTFTPKVSIDIYAGSILGSAPLKQGKFSFINTDNANVEGYGFKAIFETIGAGSALNFYFKGEAKYFLRFKEHK